MNSGAYEKFDLTGKTALVTGGGTGIGYSIARALAQSGAKVMISARRENVLKEAAVRLSDEANGNEVLYATMDLADRDSVSETAEKAIADLGGVDIFVANAAQEIYCSIDEVGYDAIDRIHQVNVAANISLVKDFLPHMRNKKWGRVIFISSILSKLASAQEKMGLYSASKAALNAYARMAAVEAGRDGITFNNINPGAYKTEILEQVLGELEDAQGREAVQQVLKDTSSVTALGRLGRCEELEGVVQMLASNAGSYITGADIVVDGGMSIMLKPNYIEE